MMSSDWFSEILQRGCQPSQVVHCGETRGMVGGSWGGGGGGGDLVLKQGLMLHNFSSGMFYVLVTGNCLGIGNCSPSLPLI